MKLFFFQPQPQQQQQLQFQTDFKYLFVFVQIICLVLSSVFPQQKFSSNEAIVIPIKHKK